MTKRCLVLLCILELLAVGCHQSPAMRAHLDLMSAEKRALEDQYYSLEFEYEDALREIEKLKQQNARLDGPSDKSRSDRLFEPKKRSGSTPNRDSTAPKPDLSPPVVDEGMLTEPRIEISPATPSQEPRKQQPPSPKPGVPPRSEPSAAPLPPPVSPQASTAPINPAAVPDLEVSTRILTLEPADPRVTQLFLNPVLTGGTDFDKQPGDDGIAVVIEPRNRDDAFVPLAGPITVLVLDPAKSADQGRVLARWDIEAAEAQKLMVNSPTVRGIQLRLPWPTKPPQTSHLHLYVRYLTVDHRDLRTDRELFITLPGQVSQRWTPRATTRSSTESGLAPKPNSSTTPTAAELTAQRPARSAIDNPSQPASTSNAAGPSEPPSTSSVRPEWRPYR